VSICVPICAYVCLCVSICVFVCVCGHVGLYARYLFYCVKVGDFDHFCVCVCVCVFFFIFYFYLFFFFKGTSGEVYPAAKIPLLALKAGTPVININPEPTRLSSKKGCMHLPGNCEQLVALIGVRWVIDQHFNSRIYKR